MSVHFMVDGYNLICSQADFFPDSPAPARRKLVELIEKNRPQGSSRNSITVIFDGQPGISSPPEKKVRVIYTRGSEADEYIERRVLDSKTPPDIIVVTDDKGLRKKIAAGGARFVSTDEFAGRLLTVGAKKSSPREPGEKKIDDREKRRINRELEKKWRAKD